MQSFYICHCGNTESPHNFRHAFQKTANIHRNKNQLEEFFELDAHDFPESLGTKCEKCNALAGIHETPGLEHKYIPTEYKYRNVKMVIPTDSVCNKCSIVLSQHHTVMTHHFVTKVYIKNKSDNDNIFILHPDDEDKKIIWQ
jgi:hypothetical protein